MNDRRIHACLDGEIPPEALTDAERARLAELEETAAAAARPLLAAPAPDLVDRVMASLPAPHAPPIPVAPGAWTRLREWAWRPRALTVRYRPAYALAGFAAAALAGVMLPRAAQPPEPPLAAAPWPAGSARLYVQFRLEAPDASSVELAGSFTGWQPEHSLRETAPGVWTALVPLDPGVHDYTFVIDGERWVVDPNAPRVPDSFGGENSRLFLPLPMESA